MALKDMILRWLDGPTSLLHPGRARDPREAYQLRFLAGAILLAVVVSLVALCLASTSGQWRGVIVIGMYLVLILAQAIALRLGAPVGVMAWTILATVGLVLIASAVVPSSNQLGQLYWFLLFPLAARALAVGGPHATERSQSWRAEFLAGAVALAAVFLVAWYIIAMQPPSTRLEPSPFAVALDVTLFLMSAMGLLYIHDMSARHTAEELRRLQQLLSICAWCRTIKHNDRWVSLEEYVSDRHGADITHGMCPTCYDSFTSKR